MQNESDLVWTRDRDPSGRSARILVVDDNPDIVKGLSAMLRMSGFKVMSALDGRAALVTAAEFLPGIVLLDIGLPELDGYEVARRLRTQAAFKAILIIAITGYGGEEARVQSREAGFDCHLAKPIGFDHLLTTISQFEMSPN